MLLAVMGSGSHLKRPWDESEHDVSQHEQRGVASATTPYRWSLSSDLSSPIAQRLPPILASEDHPQILREQSWTTSAEAGEPPDYNTSPRPRPDGSNKRPRLCYHKTGTADIDRVDYKPAIPTSAPSNGHDPPRFSPALKPVSGVDDAAVFRDYACGNCSNTDELMQKVVQGLLDLEVEIRQVLTLSKRRENEGAEKAMQLDLRSSLMWACGSIETSTYLLKEGATNRSALSLPSMEVANTPEQPDLVSVPAALSRHILDGYEKDRTEDYSRRYHSAAHAFYPSRLLTLTPPSTMSSDPSRKGFSSGAEQMQSQSAHSPSHSGSGSTYGSGQSPMHTQGPFRTLPSPSSLTYPSSAAGLPAAAAAAYASGMTQSVANAHLQDLQHQISTKTLALQTLQREHDQLLGAFSRSQIRCSTLDKKSQVSDHEINSLTEEKIRLQGQVETLEAQVEDLIKAKDEVQRQTTADAAQWRQIVAMSSQLQVQGAEEAKRYKSDRESWERDRDGLQRRISELESGKLSFVDTSRSVEAAVPISVEDILASTSLETLRGEIVRLRSKCADMEVALQDLRRVAEQMDRVMGEFANIRERIHLRTRQGLHGQDALDAQVGEPSEHPVPSKLAD